MIPIRTLGASSTNCHECEEPAPDVEETTIGGVTRPLCPSCRRKWRRYLTGRFRR